MEINLENLYVDTGALRVKKDTILNVHIQKLLKKDRQTVHTLSVGLIRK